ncbi:PIG-L deacetylase family protein [Streptacidiphilus sp. N1-12]|uniref:PIG-L deacetylase family protein n=2 Tax=Streptacidiphilus alkalitolerans TaxID=3342712 RepID=A0ABV6WMV3_9ACTN
MSTRAPRDPIQAAGTPESAWAGWAELAALPEFALTGLRSAVVVAAHPDDEVLGLGGAIARLADAGVRLRLVSVTDGEASHPHSDAPAASDLARIRAVETEQALAALGAADVEVVRLGLPDTGVGLHENELIERLTGLVRGFDVCAAPWSGDVHADHEAAGRAALAAGALTGVPVVQYPVWTWHWSHPGDPRVPWGRASGIPLGADHRRRKRAALDCFASQLQPLGEKPGDAAVLPPEEVAHFLRDQEVILR